MATLGVFTPIMAETPASGFPQFVARNNHLVLAFDATAREECYFRGVMPQSYAGGAVTVLIHWTPASNTSTNVGGWYVKWERVNASQDIDADGFGTTVTAALVSANATPGILVKSAVSFANAAAIDAIVSGDPFRLFIQRDVSGDNMTDDIQLFAVEIKDS